MSTENTTNVMASSTVRVACPTGLRVLKAGEVYPLYGAMLQTALATGQVSVVQPGPDPTPRASREDKIFSAVSEIVARNDPADFTAQDNPKAAAVGALAGFNDVKVVEIEAAVEKLPKE